VPRALRAEPFGRYQLLHRIAVGGTAEVFLAFDASRRHGHELLVIKRLRDRFCDDQRYVSMFIDEKRVFSRLSHPNIIRLLEYGREGQHYFLALEHVWGESVAALATLCRRRRLRFPAGAAIYICAEIADALEHAHTLRNAQGEPSPVIHRDVTLGNVVISYDGAVKVLDYGIAKAEGRLTQTCAGQIKGTLSYITPEQIKGYPVGAFTDTYQLGVFLYKLLVGREPFAGDSEYGRIESIAHGRLAPPSACAPGFPPALEQLLLRALARAPERRFATAAELSAALREQLGPGIENGPARLAEIVAYITADRRQQQEAFVRQLLAGMEVDATAARCLRWGKEEDAALDVELAGRDRIDLWLRPSAVGDRMEDRVFRRQGQTTEAITEIESPIGVSRHARSAAPDIAASAAVADDPLDPTISRVFASSRPGPRPS